MNWGMSLLLGSALEQAFPGSKVIASGHSPIHFWCDVEFNFEFRSEFFPLIEEKMRALRNEPVRVMEMVPASAQGYFESMGREFHTDEPSVMIAQLGEYAEVVEGPVEMAGAFKLIRLDGNRIIGVAASHKKDLRDVKKRLIDAFTRANSSRAERSEVYWKLMEIWRSERKELGYEVVLPTPESVEVGCAAIMGDQERAVMDGELFDLCISHLQSFERISTMLSLASEFVLTGKLDEIKEVQPALALSEVPGRGKPRIEWRAKDAFGRSLLIGEIEMERVPTGWRIASSMYVSLDRLVRLILEK